MCAFLKLNQKEHVWRRCAPLSTCFYARTKMHVTQHTCIHSVCIITSGGVIVRNNEGNGSPRCIVVLRRRRNSHPMCVREVEKFLGTHPPSAKPTDTHTMSFIVHNLVFWIMHKIHHKRARTRSTCRVRSRTGRTKNIIVTVILSYNILFIIYYPSTLCIYTYVVNLS
jgi:hypothetical protein